MIEYRSILRRDLEFQSGTKLKAGTIVYVEQHPSGWVASHYSEKGSATCFAVEEADVSIFQRGDTGIEYVVVTPLPEEEVAADERERHEQQLLRLASKAKEYRKEAAYIEKMLKEESS